MKQRTFVWTHAGDQEGKETVVTFATYNYNGTDYIVEVTSITGEYADIKAGRLLFPAWTHGGWAYDSRRAVRIENLQDVRQAETMEEYKENCNV